MRCLIALLGLLILPIQLACQTQVRQMDRPNPDANISYLVARRAWEVVVAGEVVGSVVEFEEPDGERSYFSVRNSRHQELGLVDVHGRAWRFHAHQDAPEWLGTGTVQEGAEGILELVLPPEMYEISLELLSATGGES